ncbi:hypothetical protein [Fredinandcohnia sp. FSL W7-1320]|uniref:hypothetical protein n=1 Tax=Fredinandcohnia sp. FSL W7-1320 TaxID=2954540 RepID=UPI0030FDADA9
MNKDKDSQSTTNHSKRKSRLFWDLFLTGGWSSFEKEWKNSKSHWHTFLLFSVPVLGAGIIVLIAVFARKIF